MPDERSLYDPSVLIRLLNGESDVLPSEKEEIKYVIYARKSREEDDRQIRSISDQISECQRLADQNGYFIVGNLAEASVPKNQTRDRNLMKWSEG